jgi:hypothetical protein
MQGAYCFHTLTQTERAIPKDEWDQVRRRMVCTLSDNFADTEAVIEKLCHDTKKCTYEEKEQLAFFFQHLSQVAGEQKRLDR